MNPEIKALWIAELRSGKYKQGTAALKRTDFSGVARHCCLGVLCEIAEEAGIITSREVDWDRNEKLTEYSDGKAVNVTALPVAVQEWAGMDSCIGEYRISGDRRYHALAQKNDEGMTFAEITEIIEQNF